MNKVLLQDKEKLVEMQDLIYLICIENIIIDLVIKIIV